MDERCKWRWTDDENGDTMFFFFSMSNHVSYMPNFSVTYAVYIAETRMKVEDSLLRDSALMQRSKCVEDV